MNNGPMLFLGILLTLATSFCGLIFAPQVQLGRQQPRLIEATGEFYPQGRPGLAERGAHVYQSLGCVECHSQQVRQTGVHFDVWVTELTTNMSVAVSAVSKAVGNLSEADAAQKLARLPVKVATGMTPAEAPELAKRLTDAGAKAEASLVVLGPDIRRQWGQRMNVAQDYLRDYPVQLGQLRLGPDLAGYGSRQTNLNAVLRYLHERPDPKSMMPPFRFLFERRNYSADETLPASALVVRPAGAEEKSGIVLIPSDAAVALAHYLLSLKSETSLIEAPIGRVPAPPTPAPAAPAAAAVSVPVP